MRGRSVNSFFETSKKASKKRRRGLLLGALRIPFNLALIHTIRGAV